MNDNRERAKKFVKKRLRVLVNEIIKYRKKVKEYPMEKKMQAVTVYVSDANNVCIKEDESCYDDGNLIILNPAQVDTVIQWLKEAKSEALQNEVSSTSE